MWAAMTEAPDAAAMEEDYHPGVGLETDPARKPRLVPAALDDDSYRCGLASEADHSGASSQCGFLSPSRKACSDSIEEFARRLL